MNDKKNEAMVTYQGALDCQVCVPGHWTDEQIKAFADSAYSCGTTHGWAIRKEGDPTLDGHPERQQCEERVGYVHVMLDA